MKEAIVLFIKGIIVGIGKIVPGVSGAMLAISLGIYEKGLKIVSNIYKELTKNIKFVVFVGLGILIGVFLFSKIVVNLLNNFYLPTILLFTGLIIGSMTDIAKKTNLKNKIHILIFVITLILILPLSFLSQENTSSYNFLGGIFMGVIEALSMIVPGLSGTALLMAFGYYEIVMNAFSTIDINVLFPFGIGILMGALIISKIINYLFEHYRDKTNVVIFGLAVSSVIILITKTLNNSYEFSELIISMLLFVVGYKISKILEK